MHLRFGATRPAGPPLPPGFKASWLSTAGTVGGYFCAIPPLTELIYTGLFERFPTLRLATPVDEVVMDKYGTNYGVKKMLVTW